MALDPHTSAAIAQLIFYIPLVPLSIYLLIANWRHGFRMAWYPPVPFSLIRLVGAILIIVEERNQANIGLIIATIILLNVGLVPLIIAFFGIVRLVLVSNFEDTKRAKRFTIIIRINILIAVSLLSTAGGFAGQPENATLQSVLSKVAYLQFASVLVALTTLCAVLYAKEGHIKVGDRVYLKWLLIASPAIALRTIYGIISVFDASGDRILTSMWSSLFGSAIAFSLMALLSEYIAVCIYLYLGWYRLRSCRRENRERVGDSLEGGPDDVPLKDTAATVVERVHK